MEATKVTLRAKVTVFEANLGNLEGLKRTLPHAIPAFSPDLYAEINIPAMFGIFLAILWLFVLSKLTKVRPIIWTLSPLVVSNDPLTDLDSQHVYNNLTKDEKRSGPLNRIFQLLIDNNSS